MADSEPANGGFSCCRALGKVRPAFLYQVTYNVVNSEADAHLADKLSS